MAAAPIDSETKASVRFHVETTTWAPAAIARNARIATSTVNRWMVENGWKRPNVTARPRMTPERLAATQHAYERGVRTAALGVLNGRTPSRIIQLAREHGWTRVSTASASADAEKDAITARPEIAAIEAALLRDPLERAELVPLIERAAAIAAADALTGRDPQAEARFAWLARAAAIVKSLPGRDARPAEEDRCHPDGITPFTFIETERLIEDIALRFEEFCRTENLEELLIEPGAASA